MKIYAHRGYSEKFPEGTRTAYLEAVNAGADGFECDVRLTRDKNIVCFHDRTLKRIAGRSGAVSRLSLIEIQNALDILTLDELLDIAITHKKDLLIETKHPVRSSGAIERAVVDLLIRNEDAIQKAGIEVAVMSFSFFAVRRLKKIYPHVMKVIKYRVALWFNRTPNIAINKDLIFTNHAELKKFDFEEVYVWTVNSKNELHAIKQNSNYKVITDCVERAKVI